MVGENQLTNGIGKRKKTARHPLGIHPHSHHHHHQVVPTMFQLPQPHLQHLNHYSYPFVGHPQHAPNPINFLNVAGSHSSPFAPLTLIPTVSGSSMTASAAARVTLSSGASSSSAIVGAHSSGPTPTGTISPVSNTTNSTTPCDLKSRIFIGNLNTNLMNKRHLHAIFIQYGEIRAISMHKGFAFIQYTDELDALNAVFAQDGQMMAGQIIDVNLVTEPKPHQKKCSPSGAAGTSERKCGTADCSTPTTSRDDGMSDKDLSNSIKKHDDIGRTRQGVKGEGERGNEEEDMDETTVESCSLDLSTSPEPPPPPPSTVKGAPDSENATQINFHGGINISLDESSSQSHGGIGEYGEKSCVPPMIGVDGDGTPTSSTASHSLLVNSKRPRIDLQYPQQQQKTPHAETIHQSSTPPSSPSLSSLSWPNGNHPGLAEISMASFPHPQYQQHPYHRQGGVSRPQYSSYQYQIPHAHQESFGDFTANAPQSSMTTTPADIMICGNCRSLFTVISDFLSHKRFAHCRLRFVCRCHAERAEASPACSSTAPSPPERLYSINSINNMEDMNSGGSMPATNSVDVPPPGDVSAIAVDDDNNDQGDGRDGSSHPQ